MHNVADHPLMIHSRLASGRHPFDTGSGRQEASRFARVEGLAIRSAAMLIRWHRNK